MENKELTFGQKLVGLTFNPSGDDQVGQVKQIFADMADLIQTLQPTEDQDKYLWNTIKGECVRKILDTQMIVVKLITLKY